MLSRFFRRKKRPFYGIDAPSIVKRYSFFGVGALLATFGLSLLPLTPWIKGIFVFMMLLGSSFLLFPVISILLGSFFFKFKIRDLLINQLTWTGGETVLDLGCGSGLLMVGAAKRLSRGKVTGVDLWSKNDQTHNSSSSALRNAELEKVREKVEIVTADMRELPFQDGHFDHILSSWAIHNIYTFEGRMKALDEAIRVLKEGGQMAIVDIVNTQEYEKYLKNLSMQDVRVLGPFYTFGTPSHLVMAKKPASKTQGRNLV